MAALNAKNKIYPLITNTLAFLIIAVMVLALSSCITTKPYINPSLPEDQTAYLTISSGKIGLLDAEQILIKNLDGREVFIRLYGSKK